MLSSSVTGNSEVTFDPTLGEIAYTISDTRLSVGFQVATPQFFDRSGIVSSSFSSGVPITDADVSLRGQDGSFNLPSAPTVGKRHHLIYQAHSFQIPISCLQTLVLMPLPLVSTLP